MSRRKTHRADCDDDYEGYCGGTTVHLGDDKHPDILGQDGEPLRYSRRAQIGFDLRAKRKKGQT